MPYTSSQISGLVGGQMAMFSNQTSYSQQIGIGAAQAPLGGGMQNPFPDVGARAAGGIGQGVSGLATGLSIASMFGGPVGMAAMAPIAALGAVGENITAGAQNIGQVGGMANQYFGSQMGKPGAGPGGSVARDTIKNIVGVMHDIVGDDVRSTMEDLKKVMDQAGRMGMLTGIGSAQEFKNRFTKIVRQVRDVADIMGTSLEEAAPMFAQMRQMGLWKAQDVMGTAMAARVAGPAAPQMMAAMGQGAQVSHMMGGTMRAGAMMGRESFMNLQAASRAGVLSQEDVMEFTGGVGGAQGQQMMAQRMTGIMSKFGQTSAGRLMMAGLGETEEGTFTGGVNRERLNKFLQGDISVNQLQQMGQKSAGGREGAMSFFRQSGKISQQLGAQGGVEAMTQIVQKVADTKFGGSEQARHQLFQQMLGVSNREAELLGKLADEMPRIQDQRTRETEANINRTFDELERKQNASWGAFKQAAQGMMDQATRPIQEAGEAMATDIGEASDRIMGAITGRVERIPMTMQERTRLLRGGALTQDFSQVGLEGMGQRAVGAGGGVMGGVSNIIQRMKEPGSLGRAMAGGGLGIIRTGGQFAPMAAAGGFMASLFGAGEEMTPQARALRRIGVGTEGGGGPLQMGGGFTTSRALVEAGARRAYMRAQSPTMSALGLENKDALLKMREGLRSTLGKHSAHLSRIKREDPRAYTQELLRLVKKDEGVGSEIGKLSEQEQLDYLAVAQEKEGFGGSELAADLRGDAMKVTGLASTPEELAEMQRELVNDIASAAGERNVTTSSLLGAAVGTLFGPVGMLLGAGGGGVLAGITGEEGVTRGGIEKALTGSGSDVFMGFLKGDITKEQAVVSLSRIKGGDQTRKLVERLSEDQEALSNVKGLAAKFEASRGAMVQTEGLRRIRAVAERGPTEVSGLGGAAGAEFSELVRAYRGGEGGKLTAGGFGAAVGQAEEFAGTLTSGQAGRLARGGGAIGRQVAAFQALGEFGGEGDVTGLTKQLKGLGYDMGQLGGTRMQEILKDKAVTEDEKEDFARISKEVIKSGLAETTEARRSSNERLLEQLRLYTDANVRFVNAVDAAVGLPKADTEPLKKTKEDSWLANLGI